MLKEILIFAGGIVTGVLGSAYVAGLTDEENLSYDNTSNSEDFSETKNSNNSNLNNA